MFSLIKRAAGGLASLVNNDKAEYSDKIKEDYKKGEILGSGASGVVYYCTREEDGKQFAYKEMKIDNEYGPTEEVLKTEYELVKRMQKQPNVLKYEMAGKTTNDKGEDVIVLIAELVKGIDLEKLIYSDIKITLEQIKWIMAQLLTGLLSMDQTDIVHIDIKPSNVMITDNFEVVIIDFGTALKVGETFTKSDFKNIFKGTENYYSLDVLEKYVNIDKKTKEITIGDDLKHYDLWCAGQIFYELWNRNILFKSIPGIKDDHRNKVKVVLDELTSGYNPFVKDPDNPTKNEEEANEFFKLIMLGSEGIPATLADVMNHPFVAEYVKYNFEKQKLFKDEDTEDLD